MFYGYARVSSTHQNDTSIEVQLERIKEIADSLGEEFKGFSEKKSGSKIEGREVLLSILNSVKEGDYFGVYDNSRLGRNTTENSLTLSKLIKTGVKVYISGKLYDETNAQDKLQFNLESAISEFYRDLQLQKTKEGVKKKRDSGNCIFAGDLIGWTLEKKEGKTVAVVDEEAASLIRKIFHEYASGKSFHQLSRELDGVKLQKVKFDFNISNLRYMLARPLYMGYYLRDAGLQRKIYSLTKEEIKSQLVKSNIYEAIVSEDEWWEVYDSWRHCKRTHAVEYKNRFTKHEISGVYRCADCGGGVTHHYRVRENGKIFNQYIFQKHFHSCSTKHYTVYSEEFLELVTRGFLFTTFLNGAQVGKFFEEKRSSFFETEKEIKTQIGAIERQIKDKKKQKGKLVDLYTVEGIEISILEEKSKALTTEIERLLERKQELERSLFSQSDDLDFLLEISSSDFLEKFILSDQEQRRNTYLKVVSSGLNFHDRLELSFINGKKFIINRPKRTNFHTKDTTFSMYFEGELESTGVISTEKYKITFDYINTEDEMVNKFYNSEMDKLSSKLDKLLKECKDNTQEFRSRYDEIDY